MCLFEKRKGEKERKERREKPSERVNVSGRRAKRERKSHEKK